MDNNDWREACESEHAARLDVESELATLRAALAQREQVITDLLASADCTWEERGLGHDWAEAVAGARAALAGGGEQDEHGQ
jgi:hypothetical protein